ncbi:ABC transporter permease [Bradyrhizobium japonicum]
MRLIVAYLSFSASSYFVFPVLHYSLRNYQTYFSDPLWVRATLVSIRVALMAAAMATLLGSMLAFGLSRGGIRGRGAVVALVLSPIILPTIVVAVATYSCWCELGSKARSSGWHSATRSMQFPMSS